MEAHCPREGSRTPSEPISHPKGSLFPSLVFPRLDAPLFSGKTPPPPRPQGVARCLQPGSCGLGPEETSGGGGAGLMDTDSPGALLSGPARQPRTVRPAQLRASSPTLGPWHFSRWPQSPKRCTREAEQRALPGRGLKAWAWRQPPPCTWGCALPSPAHGPSALPTLGGP